MTVGPAALSGSGVTDKVRDNIPKAKYTGSDFCKEESHKYHLNGWSLAGAQRIKQLTALVVKNRMQYNTSFDLRMWTFVERKQTTNSRKSKKRKAVFCGDVLTIQSDLELDPATMYPDHNPNDYTAQNNALMLIDDDAPE